MPGINFEHTRDLLQKFDFKKVFIEELGWKNPSEKQKTTFSIDGQSIERLCISELGGAVVYEVTAGDEGIPDANLRNKIQREISKLHFENLLIFIDKQRTRSLWYWVKRDQNKKIPKEHPFFREQPGDLLLSKLSAMHVDLSELDEKGNIPVSKIAERLSQALDVQKVTKEFYIEYAKIRLDFSNLIEGIDNEHDKRWYASVLLNRLMFIYFLQKKGFLNNGQMDYLQKIMQASKGRGKDRYYSESLKMLFFEGFAKPEENRSPDAKKIIGNIRYLNGGLFIPHPLEDLKTHPNIRIPDKAFEGVLDLFTRYSWNLNDTPGGADNEINPDVLGYIFEKYINQKTFGAYYTCTEITEYLCEQTINRLVLEKMNQPPIPGISKGRHFETMNELLSRLDTTLCRELLMTVLPSIRILDPACGSGAFLVAAMRTMISIYGAVIGKIEFLGDAFLTKKVEEWRTSHSSIAYFIKKQVITNNLFGVDIMEEASEITKLRLFLALVASVQKPEQLEPLPNIDFNILHGNSLIGLLRVDEAQFDKHSKQGSLFQKSYRQLVEEKQRNIETFRDTATYHEDLQSLRDEIEKSREEGYKALNDLLLNEFSNLGIKKTISTWDEKTHQEGKATKRAVQLGDLEGLEPFHWGYEFDEVMNTSGGFNIIITNPPWDIFKPNGKEFMQEYSDLITKKKMTIHEFEKELGTLLKDKDLRKAWLDYQDSFPHVSEWYRNSAQFKNQITVINGKKAGTDINLYKLFIEQCYNLLRANGLAGMVVPSGIHTDLGTMQLRKMLFDECEVTGLFGFENRKEIFEGVHRSFKFNILTFEKGGRTKSFPAAFMRHEVSELADFPKKGSLEMDVELVKRISPDSLSVPEFKCEMDVQIAEKMLKFPLLGEEVDGKPYLKLSAEFHMTNDSYLFKTSPGTGRLPLYEGKMIWQFDAHYAEPRYWIDEKEGRKAILGRTEDKKQKLGYQDFRLGFRDIASSTNERGMIASLLPQNTFAGNTVIIQNGEIESDYKWILLSVFNSYIFDWLIRLKITSHLNMFYVYQMPMPKVPDSRTLRVLIINSAKLMCNSPEFDTLAKQVGLKNWNEGVKNKNARIQLRAELDAVVAQLYGLSEEEFTHVLSTFPIVDDGVKNKSLEEFRKLTHAIDFQSILLAGENEKVEFKLVAFSDPWKQKPDDGMRKKIAEVVSAFMNSDGGELFIGIDDDKVIKGIEGEYALANQSKKNWDGYSMALTDLLKTRIEIPNAHLYFQIEKEHVESKIICRVKVSPTPEPAYVEKKLMVRVGSKTQELQGPDLIDFVTKHFKKPS
jgi:hypothetical protein